jgi:hypothetical protein
VRYFGNKPNAIKATFKSLDAHGFTIEYNTAQENGLTTVIPWPTSSAPPLKTREQIRPLLESMAKEAEEALGMVSEVQKRCKSNPLNPFIKA